MKRQNQVILANYIPSFISHGPLAAFKMKCSCPLSLIALLFERQSDALKADRIINYFFLLW